VPLRAQRAGCNRSPLGATPHNPHRRPWGFYFGALQARPASQRQHASARPYRINPSPGTVFFSWAMTGRE
jgi:hypothetical protein